MRSLTGDETALLFAGDVRFMDGEYVGVDGKHYQGPLGPITGVSPADHTSQGFSFPRRL